MQRSIIAVAGVVFLLSGAGAEESGMEYTPDAMDLVTREGRTYRCMTPIPYPDNDREYIVDHLFRTGYTDVRHWDLVPGAGCSSAQWQRGYTPVASWQTAEAGGVLTLRGQVEADLAGFHQLRVRALAAKDMEVTVSADVDGSWQRIAGPEPGVDDYGEYVGPIEGQRLHAVEVRFQAAASGPQSAAVMWVMLVKPGEPTPMATPDPSWPGLLAEPRAGDMQPTVGLLFDAEELAQLRATLAGPALAERWRETVESASRALARAPEDGVSPVVASSTQRYGRADIRTKIFPARTAMDLAYVGLVEERPEMLRHAARWALTRTLCKRWVEYGIEALDGLELSHGRFQQSTETYAMALVLDWAGSALTAEGQQVVADAIHTKGVVDIDGIMHPDSYVWHCNQGLVFERGRFAGAAAIRKWYPDEYPQREADARRMLQTGMAACVKPDGTGMEGPAYWAYTLVQVPPLAVMLGRVSGEPIRDVVPAEVAASARWAWVNRRTDTDSFQMLTYSDSGYDRGIAADLMAFFAGPLGVAEYVDLAREHAADAVDPLFLQMAAALPDGPVAMPPARTLTVYPHSGHVDVRQADEREGMRLYFLSGEWGGKSHGDRNSLILEAYGQTLLLDRATSHYTHPLHYAMIGAEAHNTVVADDLNQSRDHHGPAATLLRAEEQGPFAVIESDAAEAWPELGQKVLRRVMHLRPAALVVEDVLSWTRPVVAHQYWQSHGVWEQTAEGWVADVGGVQLCATVLSAEATVGAEEYAIDGKHRPVFRLDASLPRSRTGRVLTVLRARPSADAPWPCTVEYDAGADRLVLGVAPGQEAVIEWAGGEPRLTPPTGQATRGDR